MPPFIFVYVYIYIYYIYIYIYRERERARERAREKRESEREINLARFRPLSPWGAALGWSRPLSIRTAPFDTHSYFRISGHFRIHRHSRGGPYPTLHSTGRESYPVGEIGVQGYLAHKKQVPP